MRKKIKLYYIQSQNDDKYDAIKNIKPSDFLYYQQLVD